MSRVQLSRTAVAAFAAILLVSGCIGSGSPSENETQSGGENGAAEDKELTGDVEVVSFYPQGSPDYERLEALADEFEARYPGTNVKLIFGGGQDTPKIQARWRAGTPPEVNFGFFDGTSDQGLKYAEAGQVYPLDEAMDEELEGYGGKTWREAILPAVHPFLINPIDDKYYASPDAVTTIQFFYNKKIFDEHGVEPPATFDDLVAVADKLKAAGVAPFTVTGTFAGYMQMYLDYLLVRHAGFAPVDGAINGTRDFGTLPGVKEAADDLETLTSKGYFLEGFKATDFTAAQLNFFQGKGAMILMGSWLIGEMKDSIPADFEIGTFPFPTVEGGAGDQTAVFGTTNVMTVAQQSKNPELGVAWVKFLAEKEQQVEMVEEAGNISAYEGIPAPERFGDQASLLESEGGLTPSYFGMYTPGTTTETRDAYQQPITKLFFGEMTAAQMVAAIDEGLKGTA